MNKLGTVIFFVAGTALGATGAWFYCKKKYEKIAQEEIDSVKEIYKKKTERVNESEEPVKEVEKPEVKAEKAKLKPDLVDYAAKLKDKSYTNYSDHSNRREKETMTDKPYVIDPDDVGDDDYEIITLTYYADGVLADDQDEPVDNIARKVGADFAEHFGEYEDDSVYVRNDTYKCDYEILRDMRTYASVVGMED